MTRHKTIMAKIKGRGSVTKIAWINVTADFMKLYQLNDPRKYAANAMRELLFAELQ